MGRAMVWRGTSYFLIRAISSAGRAPALQAGCRQFEPVIAHKGDSSSLFMRILLMSFLLQYILIEFFFL